MTILKGRLVWGLFFVLIINQFSYAGDISETGDLLGTIIFENVNVVPMDREVVLYHYDVEVHGHKIAAIYPTKSKKTPVDAKIIDGKNRWLMPGLADLHIHMNPEWMSQDWPINPLRLYLSYGVTSVRCLGPYRDKTKSTTYVLDWRNKISKGLLVGPFIYSCGPILFGPVKNPRSEVLRQVSAGYDFIKLYSYLQPNEFDEAMNAADESRIYVAGHIPMMVGLDGVLNAGINEIAHIEELAWEYAPIDRSRRDLQGSEWFVYTGENLYKYFKNDLDLSCDKIITKYRSSLLAIAEKVKKSGTIVSTTLYLDYVIEEKVLDPNGFIQRPEIQFLPRSYLRKLSQYKDKHQVMFKELQDFASFKRNLDLAILWALKKVDVSLAPGTDSGTGGMGLVPGFSLIEELKILVESGFTPYKALSFGTVNASKIVSLMTGRDDFGTVATGKRADLILLGDNPLSNIDHIKNIKGVMAAGRWYDERAISDWKKP